MRIAIRIITFATAFLWVFLIGFVVSAFYSVKDVEFEFQEPHVHITSDRKIRLTLPITIDNKGYYDIGAFNVTTEIFDEEDHELITSSTSIPTVETGRKIAVSHNVTIGLNDLVQNQDYLFNDAELTVQETIAMEIAEVIPVEAATNLTLPWGAPFYDFTLGSIEYENSNETHATGSIPLHFENHAFFGFTGRIMIKMYNSKNLLVGAAQTTINVSKKTPYQALVEITVPVTGITETGFFKVTFSTPFFNTQPFVIPYG